jgi:hypothetical protein
MDLGTELPLKVPFISIALALTGAVACSNGAKESVATGSGGTGAPSCSSGVRCVDGAVCLGGKCISRTPILPNWAIEIRPPSTSLAPVTELTNLPSSAGPLSLSTDAAVDVHVTFNATSPDAMPAAGHSVLAIPSLIGGRPDLTFEIDLNLGGMKFAAPEGVLARSATVSLTPLPPADQQSPPFSFAIDTLAQNNILTIPTDNVWLHGFLHDALDQVPARGFVARAFQQGRLVSNVALIAPASSAGADGSFRLAIPAAATKQPVTVELSPQEGDSPSDPWFTSSDRSLDNLDMGVVTLPTYQTPQTFVAAVQGPHGEVIDSALVRAAAELLPRDGGVTLFSQDRLTGATAYTPAGTVELPLIPGTATTPRHYDVAVVPAAGTPFAFKCTGWDVLAGGSPGAPQGVPAIALEPRRLVSGNVTDAASSPVANVLVTASRDPETARVCAMTNAAALGPTTVKTTTNAVGAFALALDKGTYQIDYDPPAGSAVPRSTQYNVAISDVDPPMMQTKLPPPALVDGQVSDAEDEPIKNAIIRIFEPRCDAGPDCKLAPILRGETLTDDTGHFSIVVAMPPMPSP